MLDRSRLYNIITLHIWILMHVVAQKIVRTNNCQFVTILKQSKKKLSEEVSIMKHAEYDFLCLKWPIISGTWRAIATRTTTKFPLRLQGLHQTESGEIKLSGKFKDIPSIGASGNILIFCLQDNSSCLPPTLIAIWSSHVCSIQTPIRIYLWVRSTQIFL